VRRSFIAAVAFVVAGGASGCSAVADQLDGAEVEPADRADLTDLAQPILVTSEWGVVDGMLSVVVENTTDRTLRYADGVISVRTADSQLVASSLEGDPSCCGIVDLRPGQQYGFYLDVGDGGADASVVEVAYRNVSWAAAATEQPDVPDVTARPVQLERGDADAVVLADLTSRGAQSEVIAQAFVTDAAGQLIAVVSGRWNCLRPGTQPIRMQLFHPLPPGAEVDRVLVHPVVDDPTRPAPACGSSGQEL
jgi:hypothetical protein